MLAGVCKLSSIQGPIKVFFSVHFGKYHLSKWDQGILSSKLCGKIICSVIQF